MSISDIIEHNGSCRSVGLVNLVISLNIIHSFYLLALPIYDIIEHKGSYMSVGLVQ